jgi:hypothetical protein
VIGKSVSMRTVQEASNTMDYRNKTTKMCEI